MGGLRLWVLPYGLMALWRFGDSAIRRFGAEWRAVAIRRFGAACGMYRRGVFAAQRNHSGFSAMWRWGDGAILALWRFGDGAKKSPKGKSLRA